MPLFEYLKDGHAYESTVYFFWPQRAGQEAGENYRKCHCKRHLIMEYCSDKQQSLLEHFNRDWNSPIDDGTVPDCAAEPTVSQDCY